jgi:hypothetical protein
MPLERSILRTDIRHQLFILAPIPLLIFIAAPVVGFEFWRTKWGIGCCLGILWLGNKAGMAAISLQYRIAARALPTPIPGQPGVDFLFFDMEPLATFDKLKVIPDDVGFIYFSGDSYHIITLYHDLVIPIDGFLFEVLQQKGKAAGLLFRLAQESDKPVQEMVMVVKYIGDDLSVAADKNRRYEWASATIKQMASRRSVPPQIPQPS